MKPSEMFVVAVTVIALVIGLRFAPIAGGTAVTGTFGVCALIDVPYYAFRSGASLR
jgi:hypothetical protein